jgi:hypothetical protein
MIRVFQAVPLCLLLACGTAAAQGNTVASLQDDDPKVVYLAAIAVCLAGQGERDKTAAIFTENGWSLTEDRMNGVNKLASRHLGVNVEAARDGAFCLATSDQTGTDETRAMMVGLVNSDATTGLTWEEIEPGSHGCSTFQMAAQIKAEVSATADKDTCDAGDRSAVRIWFGAAP